MTAGKQSNVWNLVERESLVVHRGRTILVDDYTHMSGEEAVRIIKLHSKAALRRDLYDLLNLIDVTGSVADRDVLAALKESGKETGKFYRKTAVIGAQGVAKFFLQVINTFSSLSMVGFDTREQALEWLVQE